MSFKKGFIGLAKSATVLAMLTASVGTLTAVVAPAAMAAKDKQQLSAKMKPLGEAQKLMQEKKFKEALAVITSQVDPIQGKSEYEAYVTNEMKVYLLGQLHDNAGAAKVIETMLAANQVPADQIAAKETIVAQVAFQQKDYAKTIQFTEKLLKSDPNDADLLDLNARSYYLKGDYKTAIEGFNKLIRVKPSKPTYEFLMSSYYKLDNKAGVVSTLEKMLELYPSPEYWKDIFKYLKGEATFTEREQIEIYRLQKAAGVIEASDLTSWAELSLAMTDPGDAKTALEFGLSSNLLKEDERTKKLLNLARTQAAQDLASIDATAKEASGKPDGSALAKIGLAYLGHGQYDKAISTLQSAISKGGLKSPDEVTVQLGAAQYNAGKKAEAIKTFQSVSDKSKLNRLADLWVIYIKQH